MSKMWMRQMLKVFLSTQAIWAAGIGGGSDMVRKMKVNAAGFAEEVIKPSQDGKISKKDMVRKVAVNAAGLPEELKALQDGKIGETAMVRQSTSNTATLTEEALKHTQIGRTSGSTLVRKVSAGATDPPPEATISATDPSDEAGNATSSALVRKVAASATDPTDEDGNVTDPPPEALKPTQTQSGMTLVRTVGIKEPSLPEGQPHATQLGAASSEYEHAKTALAKMVDLVKLGDISLLQTGNKTHRKTGKQLVGLVDAVAKGGATPEVIEVISTIVGNLQTEALAKIKEDHDFAQTKIDTDLENLRNMTVSTVNQWRVATDHDTEWLACVTEEHALLQQAETCRVTEETLLQDKLTKCNTSRGSAFQDSSQKPDLSFRCDFESSDCATHLSNLKQNLDNWFETLSNKVAQEKQRYVSEKQACDAATNDYQNKVNECSGKHTAFANKEISCERKKATRSVAICTFGDKLHAKCRQKQIYDTTINSIDGTGTEYSDSERRSEWQAVSTLLCMLKNYKVTGSFTQTDLTSCESSLDYETDIGALNKKDEVYRRFIAQENFTCSESSITFNGSLWTVPDGQANSSQYTYAQHSFAINTSTGSRAFDFCNEGNDGPNCSTFPTCPANAPTRRDDATICQLATGCTIADCCFATPAPTAMPTAIPTEATPAPTDATPEPTDATPAPTDATPTPTTPSVTYGDWLRGTQPNGRDYGGGCSTSETGYFYKGVYSKNNVAYACWWHTKNQCWNDSPSKNYYSLAHHFSGLLPQGGVTWCHSRSADPCASGACQQSNSHYFGSGQVGAWGWCGNHDNGGFVCFKTSQAQPSQSSGMRSLLGHSWVLQPAAGDACSTTCSQAGAQCENYAINSQHDFQSLLNLFGATGMVATSNGYYHQASYVNGCNIHSKHCYYYNGAANPCNQPHPSIRYLCPCIP